MYSATIHRFRLAFGAGSRTASLLGWLAIAVGSTWAAAAETSKVRILEPTADSLVVGEQAVVVQIEPALARRLRRLECKVDGQSVGSVTKPPFVFRFDGGDEPSAHSIEVTAVDKDGNETVSKVETSALKLDIEVDVRELLVPVSVTDKKNRFQPELQKSDFWLTAGEKDLAVRAVWTTQIPLRLAILLDASSSMSRRMPAARRALDELLDGLNGRDQVSLSTFLNSAVLRQPFGPSDSELRKALQQVKVSHIGFTGIYDVIDAHLQTHWATEHPDLAAGIVVITDGLDTISQVSRSSVARHARRLGVPIFIIGVRSPRDPTEAALPATERLAHRKIADLAKQAGGRAHFTTSGRDLDHEIRDLLQDLRSRYQVSFTPPEVAGEMPCLELGTHREGLSARAPHNLQIGGQDYCFQRRGDSEDRAEASAP